MIAAPASSLPSVAVSDRSAWVFRLSSNNHGLHSWGESRTTCLTLNVCRRHRLKSIAQKTAWQKAQLESCHNGQKKSQAATCCRQRPFARSFDKDAHRARGYACNTVLLCEWLFACLVQYFHTLFLSAGPCEAGTRRN